MTPTMAACGGATAIPPSTPQAISEPRPERPAPDAVWVQFEPDKSGQRWSLLAKDEKLLCHLPCARWVSPESGAYLEYEKPGTTSLVAVDLPKSLGPAGGTVVAVPRLDTSAKSVSGTLILSGATLGILGLLVFGALLGIHNDAPPAALSIGLGSGALLAGAGIYVGLVSHPADVSVRAARLESPATFAFGPGFVEAASASPGGVHVLLTPLGAAGTF
jgi:hypothetical protein